MQPSRDLNQYHMLIVSWYAWRTALTSLSDAVIVAKRAARRLWTTNAAIATPSVLPRGLQDLERDAGFCKFSGSTPGQHSRDDASGTVRPILDVGLLKRYCSLRGTVCIVVVVALIRGRLRQKIRCRPAGRAARMVAVRED
jgi:hypothetical protein